MSRLYAWSIPTSLSPTPGTPLAPSPPSFNLISPENLPPSTYQSHLDFGL